MIHGSSSAPHLTSDPVHVLSAILEVIPNELSAVEQVMTRVIDASLSAPLADIVRDHMASGGKRIRARMALSAASALGLQKSQAVAWAAACELLHNATLVHDDIQDGDRTRRGRPAVWTRYGVGQAINAGDVLLMLPVLAIEEGGYSPALSWALARCLSRRAVNTAQGQALEMEMLSRESTSWADYDMAAQGKTGQLFALPFEGAALLKGYAETHARSLGESTLALGLLYQIQDDVMRMFGRDDRDPFGDIREGRVTALIAAHLTRTPSDTAGILTTLRRTSHEPGELERLRVLLVEGGTLQSVLDRAATLVTTIEADPRLVAEPDVAQVAVGLARRIDRALDGVRQQHPKQAGA